jgi:hypothetical protein
VEKRLPAVPTMICRSDHPRKATFLCECGTQFEAWIGDIKRRTTVSCGCYARSGVSAIVHGHTAEGKRSLTYNSWDSIKDRCLCPTNKDYPLYGGRGVTICNRWLSFENFLTDMGERPSGKTADRYPNKNGNYEPGNVRWATAIEQRRNRRDQNTDMNVIHEIRYRYASGEGISSLVKAFKISQSSMSNICSLKTWREDFSGVPIW